VAVAAATEVTWLLTTPPEDPSVGYGDWYQRRWLRKLARGQAFGDAFIKGKRTAQETFATEKKPNLLKNWLRINLLGDPTQGMFFDASTLEDDQHDDGEGNDTDETAAVVHSGVPVRRDGVDLTVSIDGAVAKDADWYVLDGLGTAPKDIQVELRWDASLGDLDLQVLNANRETIAGTKARGRDRITFQSTGQGTAREVLVKVHSPTHVVAYDVEVSVDLQ
jgi:hypothetical protein